MIKKIGFILLIFLLLIQLIRPARNQSAVVSPNELSLHFPVPDSVAAILKRSCNDCHSNNTAYPWYANIQPVGWWLQYHVNHGKHGLNFSEFAAYTTDRQVKKLKGIGQMVKEDDMPLDSYLWIHKYAKLDAGEKDLLIRWADSLREQIARTSFSTVPHKEL